MFHIVQPPFLLWICSLSNHLFSLSEVLCIRSAAKVKDKSDNCDESYQEVPKSRGHRQVFCSSTEKLEHIGFFAHSGDICKLTKQCLMAGLILSRLSRLTENSRFRLFHVGSKKSSVRLNSHGGLLPDCRFPYLSKDDGMTWWLPRYLPPPATSATGWRALQRKLVVAKDGLDTSALALQCHRDLHFQCTWQKPTPYTLLPLKSWEDQFVKESYH